MSKDLNKYRQVKSVDSNTNKINMKAPVMEDYSKLSKRELEVLARKYGVELDRRLRKDTLIRIVESTIEMHNKEQALLEDPLQKKFLQGMVIGVVIGLAAGVLLGKMISTLAI
tara:strand:+ start:230 stop:568 length:339 start_codon:yes stop_codon:yes gene_type:complete